MRSIMASIVHTEYRCFHQKVVEDEYVLERPSQNPDLSRLETKDLKPAVNVRKPTHVPKLNESVKRNGLKFRQFTSLMDSNQECLNAFNPTKGSHTRC